MAPPLPQVEEVPGHRRSQERKELSLLGTIADLVPAEDLHDRVAHKILSRESCARKNLVATGARLDARSSRVTLTAIISRMAECACGGAWSVPLFILVAFIALCPGVASAQEKVE